MFTPDGTRGFMFAAKDGVVQAILMVAWRREPQREAAIRAFFSSLGIAPAQDYLAGNGGVADATRVLAYPVGGNAVEVTALTLRILQELCGVPPTEALSIKYTEKWPGIGWLWPTSPLRGWVIFWGGAATKISRLRRWDRKPRRGG